MSVTKTLFSLNQKIFVVKAYFKHNENLTRVRFEFNKKFNISTADSIFKSFNSILKSFESTGSVTHKIHFDVLKDQPRAARRLLVLEPTKEFIETGSPQDDGTGTVDQVIYNVYEDGEEVMEEIVDLPFSEDQSLTEEEETHRAAESILESVTPSIIDPGNRLLSTAQPSNFSKKPSMGTRGRPSTAVTGYACPHCPKLLQSNASRETHIRIHTNERPFSCSFCDKRFKQKGALKIHTRIHTGEKPYYCTICSKGFRQNVNLQCHLKNVHGQTLDELRLRS